MIIALQLGRGGSIGFPGKNTFEVMGHAMMEYPIFAAQKSKYVDDIYVSTDDDRIKDIAKKNGCHIIDRPNYLCTKEALHQDAMVHGYNYLKDQGIDMEFLVLLQCNAPFISAGQIDSGIEMLRRRTEYDSAATVSKYNMFSPARARTIADDGTICNAIDPILFKNGMSSDKDSTGDIYYTDGTFICRPWCFEHMNEGMLPYQWMGRKSLSIMNEYGLDVDAAWQIPQVEHWLREHVEHI